jgi:HPt (histidine-containing phosphotransfer) domain-containing protein
MDDYLAKPFTLEQIKAMLTTWLGSSGRPAKREHLTLVKTSPVPADPIDDQVLDSLRQLQREGRPDILEQVIKLFFKGAVGLLEDMAKGAANGESALLYQASHALKSASANVGAVVLSSHCAQLEALAKSGVVSDAVPMVGTIREDYRVVEAILSARLPQVA